MELGDAYDLVASSADLIIKSYETKLGKDLFLGFYKQVESTWIVVKSEQNIKANRSVE